MSIYNPTCPDSCSDSVPAVLFDYCAPDVNYGQIDKLYVAAYNAASFADWTSLSEWLSRIDNTSVDIDAIRELSVMGSKPAPTRDAIEISGDRKIYSPATHTIDVKVDETNEENYEFLRTLECNSYYKIWYAAGKYLYGGYDGIIVDSFFLDDLIPENSKELNIFQGVAEWENQFHPERILNPML